MATVRPLGNRPARPPHRTLAEVAANVADARSAGAAEITGIALNTKAVVPGDLFVAAPGATTHGARFVGEALAAGAAAVLTDPAGAALLPDGVPHVVVPDPRATLGRLSAWFYDNPARAVKTIGITGTQGKTSTTFIVEAAVGAAHCGVIGSMGTRIGGMPVASTLTTPEAPQLHALLAVMREQGIEVATAEVSSHSIPLGRVDGIRFDVGVFLNIGHDHRDFHGNQANYVAAKRELLTRAYSRRALVNIDSSTGRRLSADPDVAPATFSIEGRTADWSAEDIELDAAGSAFTVRAPDGRRERFRTRLHGAFNVSNTLAAIAALGEVGYPMADLVPGLAAFEGIEGRVQFFPVDADFRVVLDAGHKPEAINALLRALRPTTPGRIITVIGSNGNRDAHKRPLMGRFAATASDVVIVTDDNPATEDPAIIRRAVLAGTRSTAAEVHEVAGRAEAIHLAVRLARAGDTLAIVGKGDERHQIMAHGIVPHSDPDEVEWALRNQVRGSA